MSTIGSTIRIKGEVRASEDIIIEGHVVGPIQCERCSIVLAATADVTGDVIGRDITIFGRATGQFVATDVVDIRAEARAAGRVVSPKFILAEGAQFTGLVEPQHLEAALRVAKFQQKQRDA